MIYVLKRMSDASEGEELPRMGKSKQGKKAKSSKGFSEAFFQVLSLYDPSWTTRIGVHFGLFLNAIQVRKKKKKTYDVGSRNRGTNQTIF